MKSKKNVTLQNFKSHLHIPWSDNTFLKEDTWLPKKTTFLLIRYGLPSTVFVNFQDLNYNFFNPPELVTTIKKPLDFIVKTLKKNLHKSDEVIYNFTEKSFNEMNVLEALKPIENEVKKKFGRLRLRLPVEFWCGNIPCRKRLFSNCPMYKYNTEEYTLFGIIFRKSFTEYEIRMRLNEVKIEDLEYSTLKEERFNKLFRLVMDQLQGYNVTDKIEDYLRNFIEQMVTTETVLNLYYINRLRPVDKYINFPRINIFGEHDLHSVALVRTFNLKWWYIDNNKVTPVENVKEFLNSIDLKLTLIPELTVWQRVYNDANLLKNLREIVQPIKRQKI
ncbi:hypothetical protein SNEBB_009410 [Seison nebaliae]|nr:hypothetical protein SNEBB_009410 [Seison nebaliae]